MLENINSYLNELLPEQSNWVTDIENLAKKEHVPIMEPLGIHFVMQQIRIQKPERILEIGTAIGYSALRMLEANPNAQVVTIEKDEQRYKQAINQLTQVNKLDQINVILGDALEVIQDLAANNHVFDFIFIDAAKGKYKRFFELSSQVIKKDGIILSDNVLFRGYVANPETTPKRYKKMVEKLRDYNEFLMNHPGFTTSIIPIGDGVALSCKR